jgi:hypothetical protein
MFPIQSEKGFEGRQDVQRGSKGLEGTKGRGTWLGMADGSWFSIRNGKPGSRGRILLDHEPEHGLGSRGDLRAFFSNQIIRPDHEWLLPTSLIGCISGFTPMKSDEGAKYLFCYLV